MVAVLTRVFGVHNLGLVEDVRRHSRSVSERFVRLFIDEVWKPFVDAGMPDSQWAAIAESMEKSRPLAAQAMLAVFRQTPGMRLLGLRVVGLVQVGVVRELAEAVLDAGGNVDGERAALARERRW